MKNRFNTVLKTLALVFFLLVMTSGCTLLGLDSKSKEVRELQASVNEITDGGFKVPLPEDYQLVSAYVSYPPLGTGINRIHLYYSVEKLDLEVLYEDEAMKEMREKQFNKKYLHGPYRGRKPIWLIYWPTTAKPSSPDGVEIKSWTINGQEVLYHYLSRGRSEAIGVNLMLDKGFLDAMYYLEEERFTEEDAKKFTTYLMDFYQLETQYRSNLTHMYQPWFLYEEFECVYPCQRHSRKQSVGSR